MGIANVGPSFQGAVLLSYYDLDRSLLGLVWAFLVTQHKTEETIVGYQKIADIVGSPELRQLFVGIQTLFVNDRELYENLLMRLAFNCSITLGGHLVEKHVVKV